MNGKTFLISMCLGVGTAVLSAYFVSKINTTGNGQQQAK